MISIAILGHGVVGSGVAEILMNNAEGVTHKAGQPVCVKQILDLRTFPELSYADRFTTNFDDILQDEEIAIVVETMGGLHPAYDFVKASLLAGKSVVTSNKEVVATFGVELCEIAASHGVRYMFEASVGGGIPIIRPMMTDLASNKINSINGILNGTTNYILTAMRDDGKSFADALGEAQRLGYAEANPAADVEGKDAARKTVILGAIASGKLVSPEAISTEGITNISLCDVELAQTLGYSIKLIGHAEERDGKLLAFVSPMAVSESNPLARIDGVFNGILVNANMVGDVMFYGPGAGKLPTASAVVADIVDVIAKRDVPVTPVGWVSAEAEDIAPLDDYVCPRLVIVDGECDNALAEVNGKSAYFTEPMTEAEAAKISAAAVYRVL